MRSTLVAIDIAADDLETLESAGLQTTSISSKALDGNTIIQAFVAISVASLPVLRQWLIGQVEKHKSTTVTIAGKKFVGYSADDVAKIIKAVEGSVRPASGDQIDHP